MAEQINWNGSVWGSTTKGTVSVSIIRQGGRFEGNLTLFEPGLGQLHANLAGEWTDKNRVTAMLRQFTGNYSIPVTLPQSGTMVGIFDPAEGTLTGEWATDAQTRGKFLLVKIESAQPTLPGTPAVPTPAPPPTGPASAGPAPNIPPLITKTVVLGAYRMDEQAVRRLASLVRNGTNVAAPVLNASHKGSEHIHVGVDNLVADPSVPAVVYNLLVTANEQAVKTGTNTVTINLKHREPNILFVSGYDPIWVEGKAAALRSFLEEHESRATHFWRKYGSYANTIIFLALLALLPSIPDLLKRVTVLAFVFLLLFLLMASWKFAANTKIFLRETKFAWYEKNAGWLLVLLEVALTGWVGYLIQRFIAANK